MKKQGLKDGFIENYACKDYTEPVKAYNQLTEHHIQILLQPINYCLINPKITRLHINLFVFYSHDKSMSYGQAWSLNSF